MLTGPPEGFWGAWHLCVLHRLGEILVDYTISSLWGPDREHGNMTFRAFRSPTPVCE